MIDTIKWASLLEYTTRLGKTVPEMKQWAKDQGIQHPQYSWMMDRAAAEELLAQEHTT
jgi:hypothetical protein